jgi:hypothetical protein
MRRPWATFFVPLVLSGCYASHERPRDAGPMPDAPTCDPSTMPRCMRRDAPCEPWRLVDAECALLAWQCPPGARPYAPPWTSDTCLPFGDESIFGDGVNESPVVVPVGDACTWVFPLERDGAIRLVAADVHESCETLGPPSGPIEDVPAPGTYVSLGSAIETPGGTRLLARAWQFDAAAPFGVRALGVELGRVDGPRLAFDGPFLFDGATDLGDAALIDGDFVYAYGCPGEPHELEEDCIVGRAHIDAIDDAAAWSVLGDEGWGIGEPVRVFGGGPHRSAVVPDPRGAGFVHVYAIGFGDELLFDVASRPEGPWSAPSTLAPCILPADDPGAYCGGPQVHRELTDPLDPGAIVVSYSIGTTSEDQAERRARDPRGYWPHVVRLRLP